jgi:membrane fusion protein
LFRQEAIEVQRQNRQWGHVALLQPFSTKRITWFIATAVALVVLFLFFAPHARKETVTGYLTPTAGTAKIFASQQGAIKEVYMRRSKKGQPLLAVETSQIASNGQDVNAAVLAALQSQRDMLKTQITAEEIG